MTGTLWPQTLEIARHYVPLGEASNTNCGCRTHALNNAFWEIHVQLVRDTSHPGNNKTIYISLQQGKHHSQKLRWPSFLMSKLTNLPLFACCRLLHGVQSWDAIHHPPDGLSDCARSSVLWATSAHLSIPGLNDVPGSLPTVEIEFLAKLGSY